MFQITSMISVPKDSSCLHRRCVCMSVCVCVCVCGGRGGGRRIVVRVGCMWMCVYVFEFVSVHVHVCVHACVRVCVCCVCVCVCERERERDRQTDLIDLFIERMTVLGRGLVFQPVLVTHTCTYSNNNIITLQNIDITDFPSNNNKKQNQKKQKNTDPPLPSPKPTTTTTKEDTSECFDMSLLLLLLGVHSLHDQGRSGDEWRRLLQLLLAAVEFGRQGSADRPHVFSCGFVKWASL